VNEVKVNSELILERQGKVLVTCANVAVSDAEPVQLVCAITGGSEENVKARKDTCCFERFESGGFRIGLIRPHFFLQSGDKTSPAITSKFGIKYADDTPERSIQVSKVRCLHHLIAA